MTRGLVQIGGSTIGAKGHTSIPTKHSSLRKKDILTLQMIFFDGEEAFQRWSKDDSLYGSKHLAKLWNTKKFPEGRQKDFCKNHGDFVSFLDRMDVLVLLDLIGSSNPSFHSYFPDTHSLYMELVNAEQKLNSLKHIESHPPEVKTNYFSKYSTLSFIEDDHIPFMKKNVPIIHIIPSPFPSVWHRESDNRENLHHPTINNLNKIITVFVAEYLHLNPETEKISEI
ncbi:glutaminyl-peptide cyclotransferase-like [Centruroides sculpturatus]|uniref:glutaminyl-peptide cyclotransferase-like n=1 Tax=Centruroides sculpturatus TaxID=218467 RepID=UPI000C6CC9F3|nr:glutaminyl-peptide cyclotransferase-like [Centruroides sculpturatus]